MLGLNKIIPNNPEMKPTQKLKKIITPRSI